jgi:hypothetical protein
MPACRENPGAFATRSFTGSSPASAVIAINTATYWHALRRNGIMDRFEGFGALMEEY